MKTIREKEKEAFEALKELFRYRNPMQAPRLQKVVINVGIGSAKDKKRSLEIVSDRLAKFTGQKPAVRGAKKSIASFKVREGDPVGFQVTLRGPKMYGFLEKLIHVGLPRMKDFRGIRVSSIDEMSNLTLGIREHTIFPETSDEELRDIFGFSVTVVTTASSRKEVEAFLRQLGFPLRARAETAERAVASSKRAKARSAKA